MILDIVGVLRALDFVQGSPSLTPAEKREIAAELKASMPARMLCSKAHRTHDIITGLIDRTTQEETLAGSSQEDTAEKQQLSTGSSLQDVIARDDRKANGGFAKVERGKRQASLQNARTA